MKYLANRIPTSALLAQSKAIELGRQRQLILDQYSILLNYIYNRIPIGLNVNSVDINAYKNNMAKLLSIDWLLYFPIESIDYIISKSNSLSDLDNIICEIIDDNLRDILSYMLDESDDIDTLIKILDNEDNISYKMIILYSLERIENIILGEDIDIVNYLEQNKQERSNLSTGYRKLVNLLPKHEFIVNTTNIYASFSSKKGKNILYNSNDTSDIPLNRHIFFHGLVDDKYCTKSLAYKALMFYGSIKSLIVDKTPLRLN